MRLGTLSCAISLSMSSVVAGRFNICFTMILRNRFRWMQARWHLSVDGRNKREKRKCNRPFFVKRVDIVSSMFKAFTLLHRWHGWCRGASEPSQHLRKHFGFVFPVLPRSPHYNVGGLWTAPRTPNIVMGGAGVRINSKFDFSLISPIYGLRIFDCIALATQICKQVCCCRTEGHVDPACSVHTSVSDNQYIYM